MPNNNAKAPEMTLRKTADGWELNSPSTNRDFHIREEGDAWVLDIFDSRQEAKDGLIDSTECESFQDAVEAAFDEDD